MRAVSNVVIVKWVCLLIGGLSFIWMPVQAQDLSHLGYLRFVNATGYDEVLMVKINGENIHPKGYKTGQATGAIGFPEGTLNIELEHTVLGEQKVPVRMVPGMVTSLVALPLVEESKKEGEEPKVVLTHQLVDQEITDGKDSNLTVVQITPADQLSLSIAGNALAAPKGKPETMPITGSMGDFPDIKIGELKVCTLNFVDPGDQVLVLFTNKEGLLQHITFNNLVR